jgi:phosphatidylinositol-3-phosphatase
MKWALAVLLLLGLALPVDAAADQAHLESIVQDVPAATAHRYGARDNLGNSLDTLKIMNRPDGGYLGVYHTSVAGTFYVKVATSNDLLTWTFRADLAGNASQPTISRLHDRSFLVAYEQSGGGCAGLGTGGSCLRFLHFPTVGSLLGNSPDRSFQAPRTLSSCAEGTPNIYWSRLKPDLDHSTIKVGFHYFRDCNVDRQAGGFLTNFSSWRTWVPDVANDDIQALGAVGNIGDRDSMPFGGIMYRLIEGQLSRGDFGSWRPFLFSWPTGAKRLDVHTDGGSTAFANPTFTRVNAPKGGGAVVVTMFLPREGAAPGEAGELIYYKRLGAAPEPPPRANPCEDSGAPPATYQHVVWIVFENKSYGSIIGSPDAPYINSLAHACGLATNFFAEAHPSLPNYIAMTSGATQGITDDSGPSSHLLSVPSVFSQLGSGWRSLQESMPANCAKTSSGDYAVRHNPAAYYTNVNCAGQDVPLGSTPDLSAKFTFVTPNLCHDMHDCSIRTGDDWLAGFMPKVLSSPEYQAGGTAVFITWDEDDGSSLQHIPTIVISPYTTSGTRAGGIYNHYSMLRTTEELLGLSPLGSALSSLSMRSAFGL